MSENQGGLMAQREKTYWTELNVRAISHPVKKNKRLAHKHLLEITSWSGTDCALFTLIKKRRALSWVHTPVKYTQGCASISSSVSVCPRPRQTAAWVAARSLAVRPRASRRVPKSWFRIKGAEGKQWFTKQCPTVRVMGCVGAKVRGSPVGNIGGKDHLDVICCL